MWENYISKSYLLAENFLDVPRISMLGNYLRHSLHYQFSSSSDGFWHKYCRCILLIHFYTLWVHSSFFPPSKIALPEDVYYWLLRAKAKLVYACEWNPHAVEALRRNVQANSVSDRCIILEGDNRTTAPQVWHNF